MPTTIQLPPSQIFGPSAASAALFLFRLCLSTEHFFEDKLLSSNQAVFQIITWIGAATIGWMIFTITCTTFNANIQTLLRWLKLAKVYKNDPCLLWKSEVKSPHINLQSSLKQVSKATIANNNNFKLQTADLKNMIFFSKAYMLENGSRLQLQPTL